MKFFQISSAMNNLIMALFLIFHDISQKPRLSDEISSSKINVFAKLIRFMAIYIWTKNVSPNARQGESTELFCFLLLKCRRYQLSI